MVRHRLLLFICFFGVIGNRLPLEIANHTSSQANNIFDKIAVSPTATGYSLDNSNREASFVFAAGGDIGANSRADASLRAISSTGAAFFLALGDLDYDETETDSMWCDYVQSRLGNNFPVEVVTGNHEEGSASNPGRDGYIGNHAACLPDRFHSKPLIPQMPGYPANYYFDYPEMYPLMRVVMISADLNYDGITYEFNRNEQTNYDALAATIDEAKQKGLWVVVGMHKNCITTGEKTCEIGPDLMNLLVEKSVDLVLQGHDHTYQRSKQLALGESCPVIIPESYNPSCVVDAGSDNSYTRSRGTIFLINGVVGRCCYNVHSKDREARYFAQIVGDENVLTNGIVIFTVSATRIDAQVIPSMGSWGDHFSLVSEETSSLVSPEVSTPLSSKSIKRPIFKPNADARVKSLQDLTNLGSSTVLRTDGSPILRSFIRLNVQGLVTSYRVKIQALQKHTEGN